MSQGAEVWQVPEPRPDIAIEFLKRRFSNCNRGNLELAWSTMETGRPSHVRHFGLDDYKNIADLVNYISRQVGWNLYYIDATTRRDDHNRSADTDLVQCPGIRLDQDKIEHTSRTIETLIQPHTWVHTGTRPWLRRQAQVQSSEPLVSAAMIRDFNQRFVQLLGGDTAVTNPMRLMRLPGSIAWPYKRGELIVDRVPELVTFHVNPNNRTTAYPISMLAATLPALTSSTPYDIRPVEGPEERMPLHVPELSMPFPGEPSTGAADRTRPPPDPELAQPQPGSRRDSDSAIRELSTPGCIDWHVKMTALVGSLAGRGWTDFEIQQLVPQINVPDHTGRYYTHAECAREVQEAVNGARRKWDNPNPVQLVVDRVDVVRSKFEAVPGVGLRAALASNTFFDMLSLSDANTHHGGAPRFLVDGLVPRACMTLLTGIPGSGKSPFVQRIVASLLANKGLSDKYGIVETGLRIVYVAAESPNQTTTNITNETMRITNLSRDDVNALAAGRLAFLTGKRRDGSNNYPFFLEQNVQEFIASVHAACEPDGQLGGGKPDMFVLDTLRAMSLGGISNDEDMQKVQGGIDAIRREWPDAAIILLHHAPKHDPEGSAGSNRLTAMAENVFSLVPIEAASDISDPKYTKRLEYAKDVTGERSAHVVVMNLRNKLFRQADNMRLCIRVNDATAAVLIDDEISGGSMTFDPIEGQSIYSHAVTQQTSDAAADLATPPGIDTMYDDEGWLE